MKVQTSILNLTEMLSRIVCSDLVNSAILVFKDGRITSQGSGIQDKAGKVDGTMPFMVSYPAIVEEEGIVPIADLKAAISKIDIFEKEDQVSLTIADNKLVIDRETPKRILTIDLADEKFILTAYKDQQTAIFAQDKVTLRTPKGKEKEIPLTAQIICDSAFLKNFASAAQKMSPNKIPLQTKEGKFFSAMKGTNSDLMAEIKTDKCEGEALSKYGEELIQLFNIGFGLATIGFSDNAPITIQYELNDKKCNYMLSPTKKK